MSRRHYLITYDVSDDKRRNRVFTLLQGNGDHAQFSVFLCELNATELAQLRARLTPMINAAEDQILIVDFGKVHDDAQVNVEAVGRIYSPPARTMIV
jgi:CRISPR-associated protein Cas2